MAKKPKMGNSPLIAQGEYPTPGVQKHVAFDMIEAAAEDAEKREREERAPDKEATCRD